MKHILPLLLLAWPLVTFAAQPYALGWKSSPTHSKGLRQLPRMAVPVPSKASLESLMPPVYDQGSIGSCTANAGCAAFDFKWKVQHGEFVTPSRLDLYQNELRHDGNFPNDAGSYTSSILWVLVNQGVARDTCWPYNPSKLAYAAPKCANDSRGQWKAVKAYDVPNDDNGQSVKRCISILKIPVLTGGYVYQSIFNPIKDRSTGEWYVPMPSGRSVGGHEILICGYDDNLVIAKRKGWARIRNSWGTTWADKGYSWIPYDYIFNPRQFEDNGSIEIVSGK